MHRQHLKAGDVVEFAIWLTGAETERELQHWKTVVIPKVHADTIAQHHVELSPFSFTEKKPGTERVPPVPDHVKGPDVRLLVAEAKVGRSTRKEIVRASGFVHDLTKDDLAKLRKITRRAHRRTHPGDVLSDKAADQVIEYLGPEAAVKTLRGDESVH